MREDQPQICDIALYSLSINGYDISSEKINTNYSNETMHCLRVQ